MLAFIYFFLALSASEASTQVPPLLARKLNKRTSVQQEYVGRVEVLNDQFVGQRMLLGSIRQADIKRHRIKSVQERVAYNNGLLWKEERFDASGNLTFRKIGSQLHQWPSSEYSQSFAYEYDPMGKPLAVLVFGDSTKRVQHRSSYLYTRTGRLKRVGGYRFTYYANGQLASVAGGGNTEYYEYNAQGLLSRIVFGHQPGVVACGNGTVEWRGHYNVQGQLVQEQHLGSPSRAYRLTYDAAGLLTSRSFDPARELGPGTYEYHYEYQNGLLTRIIAYFNENVEATTTYEYEQYEN